MFVGEEGAGEGGDSSESRVRVGFGATEFERRRDGGDGGCRCPQLVVPRMPFAYVSVMVLSAAPLLHGKSEKLLLLGRGAGGPLKGRGNGDGDSRKAETLLLVLKGLLVRGANIGGGGGSGGGSTVNVIPTGPNALERSASVRP